MRIFFTIPKLTDAIFLQFQLFWFLSLWVRNVRFSENLACFVFLKHSLRDSLFCLITDKLQKRLYYWYKKRLQTETQCSVKNQQLFLGQQITLTNSFKILTHFWPMFLFCTPWKYQKTKGFLMFSGGIKWEHWPEMG